MVEKLWKVGIVVLVIGIYLFVRSNRVNKAYGKTIDKEGVVVENVQLEAHIKTNKGTINLKLFPEVAPVTVANFVTLAKSGYYDGIKFHRVIEDFMIQGGDPTGTGAGGPGYSFQDEFDSNYTFSKPGILAMANAGPGTNGSQFFITHVPTEWLNNKHTIFGEVVADSDQEVVNAVSQGDVMEEVTITGDVDKFLEANKEVVDSIKEALAENK